MTVGLSKGYCDLASNCFLYIHYNWELPSGQQIWIQTRDHPLKYGSQKQNNRLRHWQKRFDIPTSHMSLSIKSLQAKQVKHRAARLDTAQVEQTVSMSAFLQLLIKSSQGISPRQQDKVPWHNWLRRTSWFSNHAYFVLLFIFYAFSTVQRRKTALQSIKSLNLFLIKEKELTRFSCQSI